MAETPMNTAIAETGRFMETLADILIVVGGLNWAAFQYTGGKDLVYYFYNALEKMKRSGFQTSVYYFVGIAAVTKAIYLISHVQKGTVALTPMPLQGIMIAVAAFLIVAGANWLTVAMQPGGAEDPRGNDLIQLVVKFVAGLLGTGDGSVADEASSTPGKTTGIVNKTQNSIYSIAGVCAVVYVVYKVGKFNGVPTKI